MKKIILMCSGGMSTSLLVTKMKKAAAEEDFDCEIEAHGREDMVKITESNPDLILIAPQARFMMNQVKARAKCPVVALDFTQYGQADGKQLLQFAKDNMN